MPDPDEQIVARWQGYTVTSTLIRSAAQPGEVRLDRVRSWHVRWSHDGRPSVVLLHDPVVGPARRPSRTILWFHLGGGLRDQERTTTSLPFRGRRRPEYRATVDLLASRGIPRTEDRQEVLPGTRDERLGAAVRPLLAWRVRRRRHGAGDGFLSASGL